MAARTGQGNTPPRAIIAGLAILGSLAIAAPAHASVTGDEYQALQIGQTRKHVTAVTGDRGCRVFLYADETGQLILRKVYRTSTGDLWVIIDYSRPVGNSAFHITQKGVSHDLQVAGVTPAC
jgi:hypothetical protein